MSAGRRSPCEYCDQLEAEDSSLCRTHLAAYRRGVASGLAEGRKLERADVVAHMRKQTTPDQRHLWADLFEYADVILRADHIRDAGGGGE